MARDRHEMPRRRPVAGPVDDRSGRLGVKKTSDAAMKRVMERTSGKRGIKP
ncbi:MAG: hypothetical protein Q6373_024450 [Candidatus Sigynarchaeota archaeon]